jgi:osmoprotectant transport system permease protein
VKSDYLWIKVWNYIVTKSDFWISMLGSHVKLVIWASCIVIILGVPIGILISRYKSLREPVLNVIGVLYTIPILGLFGFLIPLMGIGLKPALIALTIYGILPVIRNACVGIENVSPSVKEAAVGMGANGTQLLFRVELPLALPVIFAGIRTAIVMNFSVATYAVFIGAAGMGTIILVGMRTFNDGMLVAGTVLLAVTTVLLDRLLGWLEKIVQRKYGMESAD